MIGIEMMLAHRASNAGASPANAPLPHLLQDLHGLSAAIATMIQQ
jgi:hypothetical protein